MTSPTTINPVDNGPVPAATSRRNEGIAAAPAASAEPAERSDVRAADHPGRWLGGVIGAVLSLAAALVASRVAPEASDFSYLGLEWTQIGLLGIPIGFALGRQMLPMARSGGWGGAVAAGLALGLAAPPLGAIEILATPGLFGASGGSSSLGSLAALLLLPIAVPFSFVAVVMTVPVGVAWGLMTRLVPVAWLHALRAPEWLAAFGIRHALIVIAVWVASLAVFRPDLPW
jgi:hypothetical protein